MFSLLSGMWVYLFGTPQYNVLVLGLDNAGKSTFLYQVGTICDRKKKKQKQNAIKTHNNKSQPQLKHKKSPEPSNQMHGLDPKLRQILPTMGQNVKIMEFENMSIQFWDLPGQTGFRKIWSHYYNEVHAIVFMVDSADTNRLNEARFELHKILNELQLKYAPILVLANKQDLKNAVHFESIVKTLEIIGSSSATLTTSYTHHDGNNDDDTKDNMLNTINEHKPELTRMHQNPTIFKDRSMKVMCTCCLNKEGLSDAISWLVYTIPLAKKRLEFVAHVQQQQSEQKKL